MEVKLQSLPHRVPNPKGLRIVQTVYTVEALNEAQSSGKICILRQRFRNQALEQRDLMLRNRKDFRYEVVPDRTVFTQHSGVQEYPENDWELIFESVSYGRSWRRDYTWGAYIIPSDAQFGEGFLITDLIEDLLAATHFYYLVPADHAEAVWNGKDLIINPSSYEQILIG
jgi:hypothetical protein